MTEQEEHEEFDKQFGGDCFTPTEKKIAWDVWQARAAIAAAHEAKDSPPRL